MHSRVVVRISRRACLLLYDTRMSHISPPSFYDTHMSHMHMLCICSTCSAVLTLVWNTCVRGMHILMCMHTTRGSLPCCEEEGAWSSALSAAAGSAFLWAWEASFPLFLHPIATTGPRTMHLLDANARISLPHLPAQPLHWSKATRM